MICTNRKAKCYVSGVKTQLEDVALTHLQFWNDNNLKNKTKHGKQDNSINYMQVYAIKNLENDIQFY